MASKSIVMEKSFEEFAQEKTAEYVADAKEKGKEVNDKKVEKRVARDYLKMFVADEKNLEVVPEISDALTTLFKVTRKDSTGTRSTPKAVIVKAIRDILLNDGEITEQEVFLKSMELGGGWGRSEMKNFIKNNIKCAPEDRLWITMVNTPGEPMGTYTVVGSGPDAPEGWEGYVPVDTEIDL